MTTAYKLSRKNCLKKFSFGCLTTTPKNSLVRHFFSHAILTDSHVFLMHENHAYGVVNRYVSGFLEKNIFLTKFSNRLARKPIILTLSHTECERVRMIRPVNLVAPNKTPQQNVHYAQKQRAVSTGVALIRNSALERTAVRLSGIVEYTN